MHEPKILKQHEKLQTLIGNWEGEETMAPSHWLPDGGKRSGVIKNKKSCDGFFVTQEYAQKDGRKTTFRGHGVFGYDPMAKHYVLHWFDSIGIPGVATGSWKGKRLVFQNETPMGHCRYVYNFKSDDEFNMKIEHSQDGDSWNWMVKGIYHRK